MYFGKNVRKPYIQLYLEVQQDNNNKGCYD